jgi:hypothetical protein
MKKKSFYSSVPKAKAGQVSDKNPIPGPPLGTRVTSPTVPPMPGATKALGDHVKVPHGFRHPPHAKQGHLRMSGVPTAHRLGASGIRKTPVVNRP